MSARYLPDPGEMPPRDDFEEGPPEAQEPELDTRVLMKVMGDLRLNVAIPITALLMASMPEMNRFARAELAWDQADALLAIRKQRRREIQTRKQA